MDNWEFTKDFFIKNLENELTIKLNSKNIILLDDFLEEFLPEFSYNFDEDTPDSYAIMEIYIKLDKDNIYKKSPSNFIYKEEIKDLIYEIYSSDEPKDIANFLINFKIGSPFSSN